MDLRTNIVEQGTSTHDVLRLLFESGPVNQLECARKLGVTKAAASLHFLRLAEERIIGAESSPAAGRGRPAVQWKVSAEGNYFMGIYLYWRELAVTVIDFAADTVFHKKYTFAVNIGKEELSRLLLEAAESGCRWIGERNGILHCTFFCTGGVISSDGVFDTLVYAPEVRDFAPEKILAENLGIFCYADTLHYAYVQEECGKFPADSTVFMINWGSNFGGGVVCNKSLLSFAGDSSRRNRGLWNPGHVSVERDGALCYCGKRGCLEQYIGGFALAGKHSAVAGGDYSHFLELLRAGDVEAEDILCDAAEKMAAELYWLLELFGIDTVLFIGSLAPFFGRFADAFRKGLLKNYTEKAAEEITLVASEDAESELGHGSALVARHYYFYPHKFRSSRGVYKAVNNRLPEIQYKKK